jgi:hypothetical protein
VRLLKSMLYQNIVKMGDYQKRKHLETLLDLTSIDCVEKLDFGESLITKPLWMKITCSFIYS